MKKLILPLLLALSVSGCVTTPNAPTANVKNIAPFVTTVAQSAVPLVLAKNPSYAPVISSVATAIPAAFAAGNLDANSISSTIVLIGNKNHMSPETESVISTALLNAVTWYEATYGVKVASTTDANVEIILNAFALGLQNGVTLWQNSQPKA